MHCCAKGGQHEESGGLAFFDNTGEDKGVVLAAVFATAAIPFHGHVSKRHQLPTTGITTVRAVNTSHRIIVKPFMRHVHETH
jgi:hypothetical protein